LGEAVVTPAISVNSLSKPLVNYPEQARFDRGSKNDRNYHCGQSVGGIILLLKI
jgi:hypothetical protein